MKYTIIVGFLATVLAVSAMPKGNSDAPCVEFPKKWSDALRKCFQGVSLATYKSYMSRDTTTATRHAKCLALCIYTESGEFVDGRFDPIALEKYLREYVGSHPLLNQVVEMHIAAANAGNAEKGNNCDKAFAYRVSGGAPENQPVLERIFCKP